MNIDFMGFLCVMFIIIIIYVEVYSTGIRYYIRYWLIHKFSYQIQHK